MKPLLATPLRVDEIGGRGHRGVPPALRDRRAVKRRRRRRTETEEDDQGNHDQAEIIDLSQNGENVRDEVDRRDHVEQGPERQRFHQYGHARLAHEPDREADVREQCLQQRGP